MNERERDRRLFVACAVVREAGHLARDFFLRREQLEVELKGMQDVVSIADRAVEDRIREHLARAFPEDGIVGEEGRTTEPRGGGIWVIDPIDGTANFLRGMPYWSVVVAFLIDGQTEIGITYDPVHDELFWASRRGGAFRDGQPIQVSACTDPRRAAVGSTFGFKMSIDAYCRLLEGLLRAGADHRRMGSSALMLCHTADGRLDGCASLHANAWDVLAGLLLVREAGGVSSDFLAGIALEEPNRSFACTPGLQPLLSDLLGLPASR